MRARTAFRLLDERVPDELRNVENRLARAHLACPDAQHVGEPPVSLVIAQVRDVTLLFSRRLWLPRRTPCIHGASTDPIVASGRAHSRLFATPLFRLPEAGNRIVANGGEPA